MQDLILLHGALGAEDTLQPLAKALGDRFRVIPYTFEGHGSRSGEGDAFSIAGFGKSILSLIREKGLSKPVVFGYSMGGYVAAALEANHPGTFRAVATLATKWTWTMEIATNETGMLNPALMQAKAPKFADALALRHGAESWMGVLIKTAAMLKDMGANPPVTDEKLQSVQVPFLLCLGDNDKMVSLDETLASRKSIAGAQLCMLPGTSHPLETAPVEILAAVLGRFFEGAVNGTYGGGRCYTRGTID